MMWITPLLVATSAAVSCDVVHRDLVISNCHCQLRALQASHLLFSCLQVRAHDLSTRDDMVLQDVCQITACKKLLCSDVLFTVTLPSATVTGSSEPCRFPTFCSPAFKSVLRTLAPGMTWYFRMSARSSRA